MLGTLCFAQPTAMMLLSSRAKRGDLLTTEYLPGDCFAGAHNDGVSLRGATTTRQPPATKNPLHARRRRVRLQGAIGQGGPIEVWAAGCGFRPTPEGGPGGGKKRMGGVFFASRFFDEEKMRLAPVVGGREECRYRRGAKPVPPALPRRSKMLGTLRFAQPTATMLLSSRAKRGDLLTTEYYSGRLLHWRSQ